MIFMALLDSLMTAIVAVVKFGVCNSRVRETAASDILRVDIADCEKRKEMPEITIEVQRILKMKDFYQTQCQEIRFSQAGSRPSLIHREIGGLSSKTNNTLSLSNVW